MFLNSNDIISYFSKRELDPQSTSYLTVHGKRYAYMLAEIRKIRGRLTSTHDPIKTMDIGPSFFTELYKREFPEDHLFTLGLNAPENRSGHFPQSVKYDETSHFFFNLNDCQYTDRWLKETPQCDIVIMAEVIEHLYTAPEIVLQFVKQLLKPNGYLILLTPNAVELTKRTKLMFLGKNPYQMFRVESENPGHYREYTKDELEKISRELDLKILKSFQTNYFLYDSTKSGLQKMIRSISLPNFRRYLFMVLQNS